MAQFHQPQIDEVTTHSHVLSYKQTHVDLRTSNNNCHNLIVFVLMSFDACLEYNFCFQFLI